MVSLKQMPEKVQEDQDPKQKAKPNLARPRAVQRGKLGIAFSISRLANVLIMIRVIVLSSTLTLKRDPRGKEKEREVNLKNLNVAVRNTDNVDKIAVQLLQVVVRTRLVRLLATNDQTLVVKSYLGTNAQCISSHIMFVYKCSMH